MASNHQSVFDSFFFPLMCPRQIQFPAKAEYFRGTGLSGAFKRWFFTALNQVPVDRSDKASGDAMIKTASVILNRGDVFGIYPEGTRSPDGRIYRGRTGMARIAVATGAPIYPIGMIGARDANPIGTIILRPKKVRIVVGDAIEPIKWLTAQGYEDLNSKEAIRALTDHVMHTLSHLTGYPYVDVYGSEVRKSLDNGLGYPAGAHLSDSVQY